MPARQYAQLLEVIKGSKAFIAPGGYGQGFAIIRRRDGGTCEHCGNAHMVYYVRPLDMWLCSQCIGTWDGG